MFLFQVSFLFLLLLPLFFLLNNSIKHTASFVIFFLSIFLLLRLDLVFLPFFFSSSILFLLVSVPLVLSHSYLAYLPHSSFSKFPSSFFLSRSPYSSYQIIQYNPLLHSFSKARELTDVPIPSEDGGGVRNRLIVV